MDWHAMNTGAPLSGLMDLVLARTTAAAQRAACLERLPFVIRFHARGSHLTLLQAAVRFLVVAAVT